MLRERDLLLNVSGGGTGRQILINDGILIGQGGGALNSVSGTVGQIVTGQGSTTDPSWTGPNWSYTASANTLFANNNASQASHQGFGLVLTPVSTGNILIIMCGDAGNNTLSDGITVCGLRYGTGAIPANGAADSGTNVQLSNCAITNSGLAGPGVFPFMFVGIATGLTLNTQYWIDSSDEIITGGTCKSNSNPVLMVYELR